MHSWDHIKTFYNQCVKTEDKILGLGILGLNVLGLILIGINALTTQYTGLWYVVGQWVLGMPLLLGLLIFSLWARDHSPKVSYFMRTFCWYFFIIMAAGIFTTGIQYTPFPIIDNTLIKWDLALNVDVNQLTNWTTQHPILKDILTRAYATMGLQLVILPLLLAGLRDKLMVNRYLLVAIISFVIGGFVYYFWPTVAPAGIYDNFNFSLAQMATSLKFYAVHASQPVSVVDGGMIAFPSFHVTWAAVLTYACWQRKWLFYPLVIINVLLVAATVLLGWHYLIDVFGGLALGAVSIAIAAWVQKRFNLYQPQTAKAKIPTRSAKPAIQPAHLSA